MSIDSILETCLKAIKKLFPFNRKGSTLVKSQQRITFSLYSAMVVIGLVTNLCGLSGPQESTILLLNAIFLFSWILLLSAYFCRWLSMVKTFCVMAIVAQLFTSNELLLCAFNLSDYNLMLIIGNMFLLTANAQFVLVAYMKYTSYILAGMSVATYTACVFITGNEILENFFILVVLLLMAFAILGNLLVMNIRRLDEDNKALKKEEEDILDILKMNSAELKAYIELAKRKLDVVDARRLLDVFGDEAHNNIVRNVKDALAAKGIERANLAAIFPELSPSELEICGWVIQDKSFSEVCLLLGKTVSNISCQRTNIRKKLGLSQGDNLKEVLQKRFREAVRQ